MFTNILKGDLGRLFKGHTFHLSQSNWNGQTELCLFQSYFSSQSVSCIYNTEKNITRIAFTYYPINNKIPKWFKKYGDRSDQLALPHVHQVENQNLELKIWAGSQIQLSKTENHNGLYFTSHRSNIDIFCDLRHRFKIIRDHIKNLSDQDLISFDISHELNANGVLILPKDILEK